MARTSPYYLFSACEKEAHAECANFYFANGVPTLCACACHGWQEPAREEVR